MPKLVDVEQRRAELARACWRVVARDGIAGLTTRGVAREAGVSPAILFHYFQDKEGLILAAFELLCDRFRDHLYPSVAAAPDSLDRIRRAARSNLPLDPDRRVEFSVWLSMWAHTYTNEPLRLRQQELYQAWRELLAGWIADAIDDGTIRDDLDPHVAATQLTGLTDGLIVQMLIDPEHPDTGRLAVDAVDDLLNTWRAHPKA